MDNWNLLVGGGIIGFCVGVLTGLFGAGGGFIVTPALNIFLNLPLNMAVGTSACQVLGASGFSLFHHLDKRLLGIRVAFYIGCGIPVGSYFGVAVVDMFKSMPPISFHHKELSAVDFILLIIFLVFLSLIAGWLFFDNFWLRRGKEEDESNHVGLLAKLKIPPLLRSRTIPSGEISIPVLVVLGLFIGFLSGLLGIGGGVIMMPMLFYLIGQETKYAVLSSTMLVFTSGVFATVFHALKSNVNYFLVIVLICGAFFGTKTGAEIQKKVSGKSIRKYFAFVVLAAVFMVLYKLIVMIY